MEKEKLLICLILLSSLQNPANGYEKNEELPIYYGCIPERVKIDYSYLKAGEWLGNTDLLEKKLAIHSKSHQICDDAWTLMNCYQITSTK
jgi:hypothetical protein